MRKNRKLALSKDKGFIYLFWRPVFPDPQQHVCVCASVRVSVSAWASPHITPNKDIFEPPTDSTSRSQKAVSEGLSKQKQNLVFTQHLKLESY